MQELVVRLKEFALDQGPEILIAIVILIVGWVVALLGALRLEGETNVLASVTGASRDSCSGVLYLP